MSWATCEVCELFISEGDITCTCDEEFEDWCRECWNTYNTELETNGKKYKLCDECFANSLTAEQYDSKEIEKEQYDEAEIEKER